MNDSMLGVVKALPQPPRAPPTRPVNGGVGTSVTENQNTRLQAGGCVR